ncbi:MAG: carbamoyl-phosphate synthase large subunit, partial [Pseudomonadota bacterium]|nr:carbamoyl-phosphate synthase large subunit [Pseudomonadota bacterium]
LHIVRSGIDASPTNEVLIEESLLGWKEYEMEVVRDRKDNCIIVCSIENLDPMGVHTGDSITVAPAQTLTDKEYQIMRDASIQVLREIGVDTGGSNVQFAINPADGAMVVIEMNPRVSRSSALASKATGFPIAKVAAKLAVGYSLDEIANEVTGGATPASFEPSIDYVVTKVPRFAFEKFPQANDRLTTQMKSVGEVMAIGRTFQESFQKALRGLEIGVDGLNQRTRDRETLEKELGEPGPERIWYVGDAFENDFTLEEVHRLTHIDPWFLDQIKQIVELEMELDDKKLDEIDAKTLLELKRKGFSDRRLAYLFNTDEKTVRARRHKLGIRPVYKRVDTCAAEFASKTAYLYSTYEDECEAEPSSRKKIMVLGGGPNRIGQGIEFDYCCVHAAFALRDDGFETIMVNCNPETVSTDYDTSDRLYFEPVTLEDVLEIVHVEKPWGVIVQYGGQTPLKLARELAAAGVPIIGTSADSIDIAEDRERFQKLLHKLKLRQPSNRTARSPADAVKLAEEIGYPVVVRPSYVLGGRAMEIVHDKVNLLQYMENAVRVSNDSPVLIDRYLSDAIEIDVDCVSDGSEVMIGGIMEHVEQAGVHSGDSACCLPPHSLASHVERELRRQTALMARALKVVGLMNVQYAIQRDTVYVLEVNPRASRTVPFVSKATALPLAMIAARCMAGRSLKEQGVEEVTPWYFSVKEAVFPFARFPGVDTILGPEMKSTGEVMGIGETFGEAFVKSQLAAGVRLPDGGKAFISVRDGDKLAAVQVARDLVELGFALLATRGTAGVLKSHGIPVAQVNKVAEGRPHIVDMIKNGEVNLIINTAEATRTAASDSRSIRTTALARRVTYYTTVAGAKAACAGMKHISQLEPYRLQELHAKLRRTETEPAVT